MNNDDNQYQADLVSEDQEPVAPNTQPWDHTDHSISHNPNSVGGYGHPDLGDSGAAPFEVTSHAVDVTQDPSSMPVYGTQVSGLHQPTQFTDANSSDSNSTSQENGESGTSNQPSTAAEHSTASSSPTHRQLAASEETADHGSGSLPESSKAEGSNDQQLRFDPHSPPAGGTPTGLRILDDGQHNLDLPTNDQAEHTAPNSGGWAENAENTEQEMQATPAASRARSLRTERLYERYSRFLWKRCVLARSPDPQQPVVVTPVQVTVDFIAARETTADASWRTYRAGLLWYLAAHRNEGPLFEEGYQLLVSEPLSHRRGPETDARKNRAKRTIPLNHLHQLLDTLGAMNRHVNWGSKTQHWLMAGLASGLRPREWLGASWLDDSKTHLCAPNGKRKMTVPIYSLVKPGESIHDIEAQHPELITPGPKFDDSTRIRNVEIESEERLYVDLHMNALNSYLDSATTPDDREKRYEAYYNSCRKTLREACIRTFGGKRQYPLYAMRSQYAANMKAELPLSEVAGRMGHEASARTTMKDYGPRSAAHKSHSGDRPTEAHSPGQKNAAAPLSEAAERTD